jgi:Integrase core domain
MLPLVPRFLRRGWERMPQTGIRGQSKSRYASQTPRRGFSSSGLPYRAHLLRDRCSRGRTVPGRVRVSRLHPGCLLQHGGRLVHDHLSTELVVDALEMALWRRKPDVALIHHTDRGSQYAALSFAKRLEEAGIVPSMGSAGSALDNAISESFVASSKTELLHRHHFLTWEAARTAIFDYIEGFYNRVRRHSSLGYSSPADYEQATMQEVAVA